MTTDSDLTIIGGGPGGYVAAIRAAQCGLGVTLVEEAELGGVCLNEGCVPSKALIHAAEAVNGDTGGTKVVADGADIPAIVRWQQDIVDKLRSGISTLLKTAGVGVIRGTGRLDGPGRVLVTPSGSAPDETITTRDIIVATGSRARALPDWPFDGQRVVTPADALTPPGASGTVVVVGGGYIGLELASAYRDLGWEVVIVEAAARILPMLDEDMAEAVERDLVRRGIEIRKEHRLERDDGRVVTASGPSGIERYTADLIIVAVGREPRTAAIGLETVGVDRDEHGLLPVDERRRTSNPSVYAIGDVTPGPALAHKAMHEGIVAAEVAAGHVAAFDPAVIPAVVYTRPEVATVGLRLDEAGRRGIDARCFDVPLTVNARALTLGAGATGIARLVVERERGLVLGAQLVGAGAGELISSFALAIELGALAEDLARTIFPHPSLSELIGETAHLAVGSPVHVRASRRSDATQGAARSVTTRGEAHHAAS